MGCYVHNIYGGLGVRELMVSGDYVRILVLFVPVISFFLLTDLTRSFGSSVINFKEFLTCRKMARQYDNILEITENLA